MMADDAAQNLVRLQQQQDQLTQQAQNYQAHMKRVQGPPAVIDRKQAREASAFGPEALATGMAASLILGPVGGVLLGVAQGLMVKKERQNMLDLIAEQEDAEAGIDDFYNGWFNDAEVATAGDEFAQAKLADMQSMRGRIKRLEKSADPADQVLAKELGSQLDAGMNTFQQDLLHNRIEQEVRQEELKRQLDGEQYTRYMNMVPRYEEESKAFDKIMGRIMSAEQLLQRGQPTDDAFVTFLAQQIADDLGQVRDEDTERWSQQGGLVSYVSGLAQKIESGGTLSNTERAELQDVFAVYMDTAERRMRSTDARFIEEGRDIGLFERPELLDNFRAGSRYDDFEFKPILRDPPSTTDTGSAVSGTFEQLGINATEAVKGEAARFRQGMEARQAEARRRDEEWMRTGERRVKKLMEMRDAASMAIGDFVDSATNSRPAMGQWGPPREPEQPVPESRPTN